MCVFECVCVFQKLLSIGVLEYKRKFYIIFNVGDVTYCEWWKQLSRRASQTALKATGFVGNLKCLMMGSSPFGPGYTSTKNTCHWSKFEDKIKLDPQVNKINIIDFKQAQLLNSFLWKSVLLLSVQIIAIPFIRGYLAPYVLVIRATSIFTGITRERIIPIAKMNTVLIRINKMQV